MNLGSVASLCLLVDAGIALVGLVSLVWELELIEVEGEPREVIKGGIMLVSTVEED